MECELPSIGADASFEELKAAMSEQSYWVRFFMRPCCPPPGEETATALVDRLAADIDGRVDLPEAERDELKEIAHSRLDWYLTLPVRHTA